MSEITLILRPEIGEKRKPVTAIALARIPVPEATQEANQGNCLPLPRRLTLRAGKWYFFATEVIHDDRSGGSCCRLFCKS